MVCVCVCVCVEWATHAKRPVASGLGGSRAEVTF